MVHPKVLGFEERFGLVFRDKGLLEAALDHTDADLKKRYAVADPKKRYGSWQGQFFSASWGVVKSKKIA